MRQHRHFTRGLLVLGALCVLSAIAAAPAWGQQAQPTPTSTSPPRPPTVTPVYPERPATVSPRASDRGGESGAAIVLRLLFAPTSAPELERREELWTAVQWQDGRGVWHDVEGWQGTLDQVEGDVGTKMWYVAERSYGDRPFSWAISHDAKSQPFARSDAFELPSGKGQVVQVTLGLKPGFTLTPAPDPPLMPGTGGVFGLPLQILLAIATIVALVAFAWPGRRKRIE